MIKKRMRLLIICLVMTALIGPMNLWSKNNSKSHVENSFYEVTSQLDEGGSVYLYASAEKVMKSIDEFVNQVRAMMRAGLSKPGEDQDALKTIDFIYGLFKRSGLTEISGVGFSSVSIGEELNRSKLAIHHYKENGDGLIWRIMGNKPHNLDELKLLPADTVIAGYGDFKINSLWEWIKKEIAASDLTKIKEGLPLVELGLYSQGIDLPKLLDALSNGMGYVIYLDSAKKCVIPIGKETLEIQDPAIALLFSVKDDYLFNLLKSKIPFAVPSGENNARKLSIPIPMGSLPFTFKPVIVQKDNRLIIASNNNIVDAMFAAKEKGNGLISTAEFKKLSSNIPEQGNSFRFISGKLLQTFTDFQKKSMEAPGMLSFMLPKNMAMFGVTQCNAEGILYTFNHSMNFEGLILMPATAGVGIIAAIAIPNMLTATQKGKQKATMGDMKSIGMAIESYMVDFGYAPKGKTLEEIQPLLVPFHIKNLPLKDGWGNDFIYSHGTGKNAADYSIASPGKDGLFDGWEQVGFYLIKDMADFNHDIILSNGQFTYGPDVKKK